MPRGLADPADAHASLPHALAVALFYGKVTPEAVRTPEVPRRAAGSAKTAMRLAARHQARASQPGTYSVPTFLLPPPHVT